ncbi:hypothetical protein ACIBSV_49270 [Embleya sp. NPDC050154]|uniref:hypothetical protein n=1 Tax=Embleya sp. NPDC050154 TaxID=3363988 RepID=UPI0037878D87
MTSVLAACPPVPGARACATYAAEHADDLQHRAHAIRLRTLHCGRPDLEVAAELAEIISP